MNKFKLTAVLFASCILFGAYAQGVDAKAGSSQSLKFAEMSGKTLDKIMSDKKEKENYEKNYGIVYKSLYGFSFYKL